MSYYLSSVKAVFHFLLPSFLRSQNPKNHQSARPLPPTAYLDGLRGLFAVITFILHYTVPWQITSHKAYGQTPEHRSFWQLPIIRIIYAGPILPVFYVTSGMVLSMKPINFIYHESWEDLQSYLTTGIFLRGMRLFMAPIVSSFSLVVFLQLGLLKFDYESVPSWVPRHPERLPTLLDQLIDWMHFVQSELTNPWTWKAEPVKYDDHLWTIPVQFRCSLFLYLILIGTSRMKPGLRRLLSFALAIYSMWMTRWDVCVHISGFIIAEYNYLTETRWNSLVPTEPSKRFGVQKMLHSVSGLLWILIFICGLYIGSFPVYIKGDMYLFSWLKWLSSDYNCWHSYSAIMLVFSLSNSKILQWFFTNPVLLYLGEISFSMYLVHGPVLHLFGYSLVPFLWETLGDRRDSTFQISFALGLVLLFPIVVWISDLFRRTVEVPCEGFGRWVKNTCWRA
jgi:peptidoglycan/LPS O-acetylase OafA/YrhL